MPDADGRVAAATAGWLRQARWFGDKHHEPASSRLTVLENILLTGDDTPAGSLRLLVLAVEPAAGTGSRYIVPIRCIHQPDGSVLTTDAATDPAFAHWLLTLLAAEGSVPGRRGRLRGRRTAAATRAEFAPPGSTLQVNPLGGDASNTSCAVTAPGRSAVVLKLLRRFRSGIQPEVEMGLFLEHEGWPGAPPLLGWLEYQPADEAEQAGVLATVHAGVTETESLWDVLRNTAEQGTVANQDQREMAASLGRLTAELHTTLARQPTTPAFEPLKPTAAAVSTLVTGMVEHATAVLSELAAVKTAGSLQSRLDRVAAHRLNLQERLQSLQAAPLTADFIRVHGDYHLGQVLSERPTRRLWVIDFEGEPSRPLEQRREKTSVFKDVAGVCRSFDYLARTVSRVPGASTVDAAELSKIFLQAYEQTAAGQCFWPTDPDEVQRLLAAFTLDKAIYELAYELHNRPDWLEVPLAAVERLLDAGDER